MFIKIKLLFDSKQKKREKNSSGERGAKEIVWERNGLWTQSEIGCKTH